MEKSVSFVGRLATYRYYNMDQIVGMALAEFEQDELFGVHLLADLLAAGEADDVRLEADGPRLGDLDQLASRRDGAKNASPASSVRKKQFRRR